MHRWMQVQFFAFFFTWTTFLSYWSLVLDDRGFDGATIGASITVSLVTRALAVALLFPLANRYAALGTVTRVLPWASLLVGLAFLPDTGTAGLMVVSAVFGLLYPTIMPVLETTASLGAKRGSLDYGRSRLWGSLGFIAGAGVNGAVSELWGVAPLLPLFLVALAVLAATSLAPIGDEHVAAQRSESMGSWGPLARQRVFVLALALTVLIQSSHAAYYAFGSLHLARLGAAPWLLAVFLILAPLAEMVTFRLSSRFADRAPVAGMLALATVGSVLRWALWMLPLPIGVLLASQVLHGITYGMMQVGFVQVLRRHLPAGLVAPAQGLYSALGNGAGTAVMTAVAGGLIDGSPAWAFAAMALCALGGLPLVVALARAEVRRLPAGRRETVAL